MKWFKKIKEVVTKIVPLVIELRATRLQTEMNTAALAELTKAVAALEEKIK